MSAYTVVVRDLVWEREAGACAACGNPISGYWSLQHRRARGMGSTKRIDTNQPQNLLLVCGHATSPGGCHQAMESHPAWATNKGYRVGQTRDPATVPVFIQGTGWVLLDSIGGYIPCKDPHPDETTVLAASHAALKDAS